MTSIALIALAIAALFGVAFLVARVAPHVLLDAHQAAEARLDQAPLVHALLADLAPAARVSQPRLFVIPVPDPNGFALLGNKQPIIAVTEGVFDKLDARQLRGLLALLVASLARPRARIETAIAALALIAAPFVLPSVALVRAGIRGDRWHDVDTVAATLVGASSVADTLEKLEAERRKDDRRAVSPTIAGLFCIDPSLSASPSWFDRACATHPSTATRLARLRRPPGPDPMSSA